MKHASKLTDVLPDVKWNHVKYDFVERGPVRCALHSVAVRGTPIGIDQIAILRTYLGYPLVIFYCEISR
uniref:SFRICE_009387 n=1 Tax=Spodoptera frugiperda TaxID=7108 RepID=A0A2H1V4E8_SPOFR